MGRLMDAMLVSFIDHGATPPSTLAARNAATTGASLRGAVAAGVLGFGRHHGGDALACRQLLDDGLALARGGPVDRRGRRRARATAGRGERAFRRPDSATGTTPSIRARRGCCRSPTSSRSITSTRSSSARSSMALTRHPALAGRTLPINIDGAIAAVCGDIGLPPEVADALLIISRVPGLAAHALEEQRRESPMRAIDPGSYTSDGPTERRIPDRRK